MLQTDQSKGDIESRERTYQKELKDLRAQLSELAHEKQLQKESVLQAERSIKTIRLELEDKENTVRQLHDEVSLAYEIIVFVYIWYTLLMEGHFVTNHP